MATYTHKSIRKLKEYLESDQHTVSLVGSDGSTNEIHSIEYSDRAVLGIVCAGKSFQFDMEQDAEYDIGDLEITVLKTEDVNFEEDEEPWERGNYTEYLMDMFVKIRSSTQFDLFLKYTGYKPEYVKSIKKDDEKYVVTFTRGSDTFCNKHDDYFSAAEFPKFVVKSKFTGKDIPLPYFFDDDLQTFLYKHMYVPVSDVISAVGYAIRHGDERGVTSMFLDRIKDFSK